LRKEPSRFFGTGRGEKTHANRIQLGETLAIRKKQSKVEQDEVFQSRDGTEIRKRPYDSRVVKKEKNWGKKRKERAKKLSDPKKQVGETFKYRPRARGEVGGEGDRVRHLTTRKNSTLQSSHHVAQGGEVTERKATN